MNGYVAFLKKEFTENMKNYRFLILFAVFLIFGLTGPFLAKFMPEILSAVAEEMQMSSAPVALDAWEQFYKNISGVGFSAFIILFGSCMSGEYSKGTLVLLLTKGLPRSAVIFAKYTVAAVLMTVCYWAGFFCDVLLHELFVAGCGPFECLYRRILSMADRFFVPEHPASWLRDVQADLHRHPVYRRPRGGYIPAGDREAAGEVQPVPF